MQTEKLYVPANITLRREWWKGFGDKELAVSGMSLILSVAAAIMLGTVFKISVIICVLIVMGVVALTVTAVQKTDSGLSMVDYIIIIVSYHKSQQSYDYIYTEGCDTFEKR